MSGGISSLSNATYIIPEKVQVEKKGPVKATIVAGGGGVRVRVRGRAMLRNSKFIFSSAVRTVRGGVG